MGGVLRQQGKLAEAVAAYCKALQLRPEYADAMGNLVLQRYVPSVRLDVAA